ncbi:MAG: hypothetical protein ABR499_04920 [Gemmatimonadaceae bacterium]
MRYLSGSRAQRAKKVAKTVAAAIGAATLLLAMSGCASIPRRAWDNGAAMSSRDAYQAMMRGERGFHAMKRVYSSMDPRPSAYQAARYPYFGRW